MKQNTDVIQTVEAAVIEITARLAVIAEHPELITEKARASTISQKRRYNRKMRRYIAAKKKEIAENAKKKNSQTEDEQNDKQ